MNLYERVLPYLLRETASAVWELGPAKLFLGVMALLGAIKGLEIAWWLQLMIGFGMGLGYSLRATG